MSDQPRAAPSLDSRIASALNCETPSRVDRGLLAALLAEAGAALATAQKTVETESARALDLSNPDPDRSDALVRTAERTSARLQQALPLLRDKIRTLEDVEFRQAWHAKAGDLEAQRDDLAEQLAGLYQGFVTQIAGLYKHIDANAADIGRLHRQAPAGEDRRLVDAELKARGLHHYDAAHPPLRDHLLLPHWDISRDVAFPIRVDWNQQAALLNAGMARQLAQKYALTHGPGWAGARDLQIEQEQQQQDQRDAELRARELADRARYEAALKQSK